jgi:hypothetical protein
MRKKAKRLAQKARLSSSQLGGLFFKELFMKVWIFPRIFGSPWADDYPNSFKLAA